MDTISLNPTAAPMQMAAPVQKSGGSSVYIVVFFMCVISVMAGAFYYMLGQKDAESAKKLAAAKSEEEKREIQRKADLEAQKATLAAKEEMLKKAQARVDSELADAAKRVRDAKELQRKAMDVATDAANKKKEADEAMKKAEETNDANAKKLAEEKKKLADEAAAKVAEAEKKAQEALDQAKASAKKATDLQKRVDGAEAKLKGKVYEEAAKMRGVPGYIGGGVWKDAKKFKLGGVLTKNIKHPDHCAAAARQQGAFMWGWRNSKHPSKNARNTCFLYKKGWKQKFGGNGEDEAHVTGCSFGGMPNKGKGCPGYPTVKLYEHTLYRGNQWAVTGPVKNKWVGGNWNDRISSVRVPRFARLTLYKDANYGGGNVTFFNNRPGLGGWNDKASSFRVKYY